MKRLVYGVGIYEKGKYKAKINGKTTKEYNTWCSILERCYSPRYHMKRPTYIGCEICDEWKYFQIFAEWYNQNFYTIEGERIELDKDILFKGNKIYSPNNSIFVPRAINNLLTKHGRKRGKSPIGVCWYERYNKWLVQCWDGKGKQKTLGYFDTKEEAFQVYKTFKEKVIKEVIESYEDKIPGLIYIKLYKALLNYQVEIND